VAAQKQYECIHPGLLLDEEKSRRSSDRYTTIGEDSSSPYLLQQDATTMDEADGLIRDDFDNHDDDDADDNDEDDDSSSDEIASRSAAQQSTSSTGSGSCHMNYDAETSLLVHPFGLALLEYYKDHVVSEAAKDVSGTSLEDVAGQDEHTARQKAVATLADAIYNKLVVNEDPTIEESQLPMIAANLRDCLGEHFASEEWKGEDRREWTVEGERVPPIQGKVCGADNVTRSLSGVADAILSQGEKAYCVIEAYVENNEASKYLYQGHECCSILGLSCDTHIFLLVLVHIGRRLKEVLLRLCTTSRWKFSLCMLQRIQKGLVAGNGPFFGVSAFLQTTPWTWRKEGRWSTRVAVPSPALYTL
jgi:hypothetical protein